MSAPAATRIGATILAAPLEDLRRCSARGTVLATFERSAYLSLAGRIVALASADLAAGPLTITVEDFGPLRALSPGAEIALTGGRLWLGPVAVHLDAARVWNPSLELRSDAMVDPALGARDAAIDEVLTGAPGDSIVALLRSRPPARVRTTIHTGVLEGLERGLEAIAQLLSGRGHGDAVAEIIARDVAGRGPGLTPSGDDLLIGILYALWIWPRLVGAGSAAAARTLIVDAARPHTTRISAAYLEAAGSGDAAEPWHALVRSFRQSPASTRAAVRRLLRIGETSGADALTGFCWAWRRLAA
ncbi:MAG: DUF2877 domain-containing protein [Armatimonadota bacterium]